MIEVMAGRNGKKSEGLTRLTRDGPAIRLQLTLVRSN